ncbi:MAG: hypothetical protein AAF441_09310, partial [Pseudomonadota bacterium]
FIETCWIQRFSFSNSRCPPGEGGWPACQTGLPHVHWKTTTFVTGCGLDGPNNRDTIDTYMKNVLVPKLILGDIVIMDIMGSHEGHGQGPELGPPEEPIC